MSRLLGRSYDAYQISKDIKEAKIKKYKDDNSKTTWKEIEESPEKYQMYLPESAIDFLTQKKIKVCRTPFLLYAEMQIPSNDEEDRYIKFPSKKAIIKYKDELAYYIGMLLANYKIDDEENLYTFPKEYTDLLPLLIVYAEMKVNGREKEFPKKYLSILSNYVGSYITDYEAYQDYLEHEGSINLTMVDDNAYDKLMSIKAENDELIASCTAETIIQLSALDGALQIIDRCQTPDDLKNIIEKLFLNKDHDRSSLLRSEGIESYGYKRLRKELETFKGNK